MRTGGFQEVFCLVSPRSCELILNSGNWLYEQRLMLMIFSAVHLKKADFVLSDETCFGLHGINVCKSIEMFVLVLREVFCCAHSCCFPGCDHNIFLESGETSSKHRTTLVFSKFFMYSLSLAVLSHLLSIVQIDGKGSPQHLVFLLLSYILPYHYLKVLGQLLSRVPFRHCLSVGLIKCLLRKNSPTSVSILLEGCSIYQWQRRYLLMGVYFCKMKICIKH